MPTTQPTLWKPRSFEDLIGPAATAAKLAAVTVRKMRDNPQGCTKELFYGPPGVGKSALSKILALALAGEPLAVAEYSGVEVNKETVQGFRRGACMGGLFGAVQVTLIHEVDRVPPDARDLMLQHLDDLPAAHAFICTSNLEIETLKERFQSRFKLTKILGPNSDDIAAMLERWDIPAMVAQQIAIGCGGNVRAALNDLERYLDAREAGLLKAA